MDHSKRAAFVFAVGCISFIGCSGSGGAGAPSKTSVQAASTDAPRRPAQSTDDPKSHVKLPNMCDGGDAHDCQRRCDRGQADSCGMLGILTMDGTGVDRDPVHGAALFERACSGDDGASCLALAFMSEAGRNVPRDPVRSAELLKKGIALLERSCAGDDPKAGECFVLARMFEEGKVVTADRAHSEAVFRSSCEKGDMAMCDQLGTRYADGRWGRDFERAAVLFKKSCDGGFSASCMNLGILTRDGLGMAGNKDAARALFKQACEGGVREACALLDPAEEARIEMQKSEVRQLVKACEAGNKEACATLRSAKFER